MQPHNKDECAYCTRSLENLPRVYRHEKGKHPEPRPAFCSTSCITYYDNREAAERRAFAA